MKTKLTFLSLALLALLGAGMLMAFKQEEKHKQYLTASFVDKNLVIVDENGVIEKKSLSKRHDDIDAYGDITRELNLISAKKYKLISTGTLYTMGNHSVLIYTFEKQ